MTRLVENSFIPRRTSYSGRHLAKDERRIQSIKKDMEADIADLPSLMRSSLETFCAGCWLVKSFNFTSYTIYPQG